MSKYPLLRGVPSEAQAGCVIYQQHTSPPTKREVLLSRGDKAMLKNSLLKAYYEGYKRYQEHYQYNHYS